MEMQQFEVIDRRTQKEHAEEDMERLAAQSADNEAPTIQEQQGFLAEVDRVYDDPVPVFDRILVRQGAAETYWSGTRFVIPDALQKAPNEGVVVAIAEHYIVDGKLFPMADVVKPGDIVKFSKFNAEPVMSGEEEFSLVSIFDVKFVRKEHYALDGAIRS